MGEAQSNFYKDTFVDDRNISTILVIYTGGTIGMIPNNQHVLEPGCNIFKKLLLSDPQLHDDEFIRNYTSNGNRNKDLFALPYMEGLKRVVYNVLEYETLLDSSNMSMDDWSKIASDIYKNYEKYDGFVILHGTDTLSYTASALSFMFENLGKSVIITGAQIPLFQLRSDGRDNFVSSILLAGNFTIPEVTVFFNHKLFRGNRTIKHSANNFSAFESYNMPPLVKAGLKFEVDFRSVLWPNTLGKFSVHLKLNKNVALLRMYPNISKDIVKAYLRAPIEGVVIQTYGAGNMPSCRDDLIKEMKDASDRGVIIVNCTQCLSGAVTDLYATGKAYTEAGVLLGADMTPEAALAKLAYVTSKDEWDLSTKRLMMSQSLRGELTVMKISKSIQEIDIIDTVARSLKLTSRHEQEELGAILFPAILAAAIVDENLQKIADLKEYGAEIHVMNTDLRTPLHIACTLGKLKIVNYLILNGASVHMKDRYGHTPLMDAIENDHHDVIELLRSNGAHLLSQSDVGASLCRIASKGQINRLKSYWLAGVDLDTPDSDGRTALHHAVMHRKGNIVKYLLKCGTSTTCKDLLGFSPITIAETLNYRDILGYLRKE